MINRSLFTLQSLRERVRAMFTHAYDGYIHNAYPYDELRPITCDGHDTWGSFSLTLIDALDTLIIMGNHTEFSRVANLLINKMHFDIDINASVFETNIRVVGGLLSAHLFSKRAGMDLEPGWPCSGPLLRMAETMARKLLPAFDTPTGMPYGTVNLRHGVPEGETTVTCTAGVGTFLIEFGTLSRLTGDSVFEKVAMRAMRALWKSKSNLGLVGNHIDVATGKWTALDAGIGGGIDSYFEYLVKGAIMFNKSELLDMFHEYEKSLEKHVKRDDWYLWAHMTKGSITLPVFTSLDAFWPGIQSMVGDIEKGMKTIHNFHQVWKQFGFIPEYYNIPKGDVHQGREGYPLRPELAESAMYLYQATKDPYLLQIGIDMLEAIEYSTWTKCGYATVKDVQNHQLENRMESFFLAETTKYLYLLFDTDNFIHNTGNKGTLIETPNGECIIDTGAYVFNTEAHPMDIAAVHCCSAGKKENDRIIQEMHDNIDLLSLIGIDFEEDILSTRDRGKKSSKSENDFVSNFKSDIGKLSLEEVIENAAMELDISNSDGGDIMLDEGGTETMNDQQLDSSSECDDDINEGSKESVVDLGEISNEKLADVEMSKIPHKSDDSEASKVKTLPKDDSDINTNVKIEERPIQTAKNYKILGPQIQKLFGLFLGNGSPSTVKRKPSVKHLYQTLQNFSLYLDNHPENLTCRSQPYHMRLSAMGEMFIHENS
ncbi:hypothetical protein ScPMuIL_016357 [Solemya velum]